VKRVEAGARGPCVLAKLLILQDIITQKSPAEGFDWGFNSIPLEAS
jgi:hypothetical protein